MILHIIHASTGGTFPIFEQLARWDDRHEHRALAWGTEDPSEAMLREIQESRLQVRFIRKSQGLDIMAFWKIAGEIKTLKPEQIILHSATAWPGVWLARTLGQCRFKLTVPLHTFPALQSRFEKWAIASAGKQADKCICFTGEMARQYQSLSHHPNIQVIPHVLDTDFWKPSIQKTPHEILKIGYHGRLLRWKGIMEFPHYVLGLKRPFVLELIGEGADREAFLQACTEAGISDRVRILPPVTRTEIRDWLQNLDQWICFSKGETMGLSAMEAKACGAQVVVTGHPALEAMQNEGRHLTKSQWVRAWLD
jgi:glycosyltransferase involved in cell wall biosynthesis